MANTRFLFQDILYRNVCACYTARGGVAAKPLSDQVISVLRNGAFHVTIIYIDRRAGGEKTFVMADLVFRNFHTGEPTGDSGYDTHLYKVCDENGPARRPLWIAVSM